MGQPVSAVLIGTDAFPVFVNDKSHTIHPAPDHKLPAGTVPETSEEHGQHQVDIGTELTLPVAPQRNIEVIPQPR